MWSVQRNMCSKKEKALIIVESPTKIKTLKKFLGQSYLFESSVGHIIDLPPKKLGIDIENNFTPSYEPLEEKKTVIKNIKEAAKKVSKVYLCPDPDREGEAIAWHIASILPKNTVTLRATFNAITQKAVIKALESPRTIDQHLVGAQQARRLLDRIVGYQISPLLARRIKTGVSAGRVQSVALAFVVQREKEIEAFQSQEYWTIQAHFETEEEKHSLQADLIAIEGQTLQRGNDPAAATLRTKAEAEAWKKKIEKSTCRIEDIQTKEKIRRPSAPFTTSSLQQEASNKFGFSASRTMGIAQSLYEGIDLPSEGSVGLITYMRTDSIRIEPDEIASIRQHIEKKLSKKYLSEKPVIYTSKKNSQDAHEAIRPTDIHRTPESLRASLTPEQYKLYNLIWKRTAASQMAHAVYQQCQIDITSNANVMLRSTGLRMLFPGFQTLYQDFQEKEEKELALPNVKKNEALTIQSVATEQAFTKPPARYTEASLIKALEKSGIGRPSTYAQIMKKIQGRDYTIKEQGKLRPTELGCVLCDALEAHFPSIMNVNFTASLENELDAVVEDKLHWTQLLEKFWHVFSQQLGEAKEHLAPPKKTRDETCPKCGSPLQDVWHQGNFFVGCSNYPECNYRPASTVEVDKTEYDPHFDWDQNCPACSKKMTLRKGRYGPFLGCSDYPTCKTIISIPLKNEKTAPCPAEGCHGMLVQKNSRRGPFYACSAYPKCSVAAPTIEEALHKFQGTAQKPANKGIELTPSLKKICAKAPKNWKELNTYLWDYIRTHKLQDTQDKRYIIPDATLAEVTGRERFHMMGLLKKVKEHLS